MSRQTKSKSQQKSLFSKTNAIFPDGYYLNGKTNPNIRTLVEQHLKEKPFEVENDNYDVPAFDKRIEATKATAIYNMHAYWSKKPHEAIRQYITHYTKPGDLVFDPMCGSGGTALTALMEGRKAIAIDISPAATFITKNYCTPANLNEFRNAISILYDMIYPYFNILYNATCPKCGRKAIIGYTVFSSTIECLKCMNIVPLFPNGNSENKTCIECGVTFSGRERRIDKVPVRQTMKCLVGCGKKSEIFDPEITCNESELSITLPDWYQKDLDNILNVEFPTGLITRQPIASGKTRVKDIYTHRNLLAAKILLSAINKLDCSDDIKDLLKFVFNGVSLNISMMLRETKRAIQSGTYYLPPLFRELYVWNAFKYKANQVVKGIESLVSQLQGNLQLMISTQSSVDLQAIPSNSIDYIFTDPAYGAKVQFAEANYVWELWQGFDTGWWEDEIIVNEPRGKSEEQWFEMMTRVLSECYRVLKPGRAISLCFHGDTSIWTKFQETMTFSGFIPEHTDRAIYIDAREKSYKQRTANNVQLRDLVINFRKPKSGEITQDITITFSEDETTFTQKVHSIIRGFLERHPGATKDRIYDEVVSRMVRAGKMEPHNFDELLKQIADEVKQTKMKDLFTPQEPDLFRTHETSRWYLKDTEILEIDSSESAKEDAAAEKISHFINDFIEKNPELSGVHYNDIIEQIIYKVKEKPRRSPTEWLIDYFFKTEDGKYRLPGSKEEDLLKAEGRRKGTLRLIKRFIALLEQGITVPEKELPDDVTIAEWIRHCKRSGLFEQGKFLYEKGGLNIDNLPEKILIGVEEDYQVCIRMIKRSKA